MRKFETEMGMCYITNDPLSIIDEDAPIQANKMLQGEETKDMEAWATMCKKLLKPGGICCLIGN